MAALLANLGISIHAPREGGDYFSQWCYILHDISIHAPREGGDQDRNIKQRYLGISIHAPREGGDIRSSRCTTVSELFQSTPPARGATDLMAALLANLGISIHAPREGGDSKDAQFYL